MSPIKEHDDFGGLGRDLEAMVNRRSALRLLGGLTMAGALAACSGGSNESSSSGSSSSASSSSGASASGSPVPEIPDETGGPFPADGTNGPNLLTAEGVVRTDLTSSIDGLSGTAPGIPTTINLTVVDAATGEPVPGAALYLWHCTADGRYSIYEIEDQNYLRGVQVADNSGLLTFTTIFPGCYEGRWPHCHFEVYRTIDQATNGDSATKISQLAFPKTSCEAVYGRSEYGPSAEHLSVLSLATDGVFEDGWDQQLATVIGSNNDGYTANLLVAIDV